MPITNAQIDAAVPYTGFQRPVRLLLNALLRAIRDTAEAGSNVQSTVQRETPASGDTIAIGNGMRNATLVLEGSAPLADLGLQLPGGPNERLGQIVRIVARVSVDQLWFVNESVVHNVPDALFMNDAFSVQNIGPNEWTKIA